MANVWYTLWPIVRFPLNLLGERLICIDTPTPTRFGRRRESDRDAEIICSKY